MPLSQTARLYVGIWVSVAISMGMLLGLAEHWRNVLHDPDQTWQRTGMLLPAQTFLAPIAEPELRLRHRVIIFFSRNLTGRNLFSDLADQSDLVRAADLMVVTPDGSKPVIKNGIWRFATDTDGSLARSVGLHRPIDGGPPVGYVLIDSQGYIRFRTLDPGFKHRAWEIKFLLRALP